MASRRTSIISQIVNAPFPIFIRRPRPLLLLSRGTLVCSIIMAFVRGDLVLGLWNCKYLSSSPTIISFSDLLAGGRGGKTKTKKVFFPSFSFRLLLPQFPPNLIRSFQRPFLAGQISRVVRPHVWQLPFVRFPLLLTSHRVEDKLGTIEPHVRSYCPNGDGSCQIGSITCGRAARIYADDEKGTSLLAAISSMSCAVDSRRLELTCLEFKLILALRRMVHRMRRIFETHCNPRSKDCPCPCAVVTLYSEPMLVYAYRFIGHPGNVSRHGCYTL